MAEEKLIDLARSNYAIVEEMYERYQKNPKSISEEWVDVLKQLEILPVTEKMMPLMTPSSTEEASCQIHSLIEAYRRFGFLAASLNPLAKAPTEEPNALKLENFSLKQQDLPKEFPTCGIIKNEHAPLAEILRLLKKVYAGRIGFEFKDRVSPDFENWMQERIEKNHLSLDLSIEKKQMIFQQLNKSELFESFLHTKFPGQKRFSLEGAETLIPMLSEIIGKGALLGAEEFIIGMTHRGRLNVLANILNKPYTQVFSEFDEGYFPDSFEGTGDVKYHTGFLSDGLAIHGHEVKISLTPNPSHLESVDPVIEGQVKARQIKRRDANQEKIIPILTHGDAAISGQGVVYETLQLAALKGYSTGGTLHLVINNQIGFTTLPEDARSTPFCTDIAHAFSLPVFHVNAEDPEACVFAAELAYEIRHLFHTDVLISLNCYRKYGHNESDEPSFTQPIEYKTIRSKKSIRDLYRDYLLKEGVVEKFMTEGVEIEFKKALQDAGRAGMTKEIISDKDFSYQRPNGFFNPVKTGVSQSLLREIAQKVCDIPKNLKIHPKLEQLFKERLKMVFENNTALDWGMGEILAFASLLWEGVPVRLSGQDSGRGTFSHRHVLLMDQQEEKAYYPLSHLKEQQGRADMINSPLSEYAVLGFEYGYSVAYPEALVLWEAQFGDFGNNAQVIIDQYIASGEMKWGQKCSLVLLLPHGYEGQGPEHSSARLERFLTLVGHDNMYICNPSTPAQYFHLLRRQAKGPFKKPLICLTPKSLLRNPICVSPLKNFETGSFEEVIDDPEPLKESESLIFCTGKIFYELYQLRQKEKLKNIALVRIEQLYPLNKEKICALIKNYKKARNFVWVQEEPANMGGWSYIHPILTDLLPEGHLEYVGREESASSATGSYVIHKKELTTLLKKFMAPRKEPPLQISHFHPA